MNKYYITTPIYYPSANFHIGHCFCTTYTDAMARYKRLAGYDVMFLTGTDEYGQKIQRKAAEEKVTPKEYVDKIVADAQDLWTTLHITYNDFIRTTEDRHKIAVQKIFEKLYNQGDIYKGTYEGLYCTPCESFWTESQLVNGKCPDCSRDVELVKEESYFFRLSKYQDRIMKHIEENPDFIQPESRKNEMINNFLKPGLQDLCVSRTTFDWGIKVPFDDKHVVYVWLDALTNYITALGYMSDNDEKFKKYWPADVHLVGKEIMRFHTITWPAILMALDLQLPKTIFGHGWLLVEGDKISKSRNNYKDPREYISSYGVDAIRYFILREFVLGSDGNFSEEALLKRFNADLANDIGNLLSRTVAMCEKYFEGMVENANVTADVDIELINVVNENVKKSQEYMDKMQFNNALESIWNIIGRANKYIDETMPWSLAKDESNYPRLKTVLYNLVETLRIVSILIQPVMVETPIKMWRQLGIEQGEMTAWESINRFGQYKSSTKVIKEENLFNRIAH